MCPTEATHAPALPMQHASLQHVNNWVSCTQCAHTCNDMMGDEGCPGQEGGQVGSTCRAEDGGQPLVRKPLQQQVYEAPTAVARILQQQYEIGNYCQSTSKAHGEVLQKLSRQRPAP